MNVLAHHWPLGTEVSAALFSLWNSHTVIQCPIKMALVSSGAPLLWGPPAADTLILSILPSLIRLRVEMPGTPPSSLLPPSLCFFLHLLSLGSGFFPLPSLEEEQLSPLGSCAHFQFFFFLILSVGNYALPLTNLWKPSAPILFRSVRSLKGLYSSHPPSQHSLPLQCMKVWYLPSLLSLCQVKMDKPDQWMGISIN